MSSLFTYWPDFTTSNALHLIGILVLALLLNRLARRLTNSLVAGAATGVPARAAQTRAQQTRALADGLYKVASTIVWFVAALTALPEFGISAMPATVVAALAIAVIALGTRELLTDVTAGFSIAMEDQYAVGDTIDIGEIAGRVEQLTLRRTVVRDARGALVTIGNGEIRAVGNLSRDWSQSFIDISVAPDAALDKVLQALESAAAELRGDPAWSQALVDGPRVLGLHAYDHLGSTLRLQVRTMPTRQDEVCRELRRRIQMNFQAQGLSSQTAAQSGESAAAPAAVQTEERHPDSVV